VIVGAVLGVWLLSGFIFGVAYVLWRRDVVRSRLRQPIVVTLKSGGAFQGVLLSADRHAWVLRNAIALAAGDGGVNVIVDGEVLILTADIAYAQKP
jgi:hypothetical protein